MSHLRLALCVCLLTPLVASGCHVRPFWLRRAPVDLPPEAFVQTPTLNEVVYSVNANTSRVRQLQTEGATLKVDGVPALRATMAYEEPRNFRLRAQLSQFTGREIDLGSNQEVFWFWVRRDTQPAVYYARHDQFATSPARDLVPIEPNRLIETLGLVHLDPNGRHAGPTTVEGGLLEIRSQLPSPRGDMTQVLRIDGKYGWVAEQYLYDPNGQLVLTARAGKHRFYADEGVTLPHHIEVELMPGQPSQVAFEVDVANYAINRMYGGLVERWSLPKIDGYPLVDIADPGFRPPVAGIPDQGYPTNSSVYGVPRTSRVPTYRGYDTLRR